MADKRLDRFVVPDSSRDTEEGSLDSFRGALVLAACAAGADLARQTWERYTELLRRYGARAEAPPLLAEMERRFSDSELCIRVGRHVGGSDVFLFQSLYDPRAPAGVNENYMTFLIAARAFREHGARHVTAVLPYLAYSRQDKPTKFTREPTTVKLMADLSLEAGIDGLISWAPHSPQIHGFYGKMPVHLLDPLNTFLLEFERFRGRRDVVVVAPDTGAVRLTTHFSRSMQLSFAVASKYRPEPEAVEITSVVGDFTGKRTAIVLDDMVGTAGTVHALIKTLVQDKGIEAVHLAAGHNLCLPEARERMVELHERYHLESVTTTDSVPQVEGFRSLPFFSVRSLADMLCLTINRVHYDRSLSAVFLRD